MPRGRSTKTKKTWCNLSNNGDVELFDFEIGSVGDYDCGSDYDYSDDPPSYNHCVGFDHGGDGGGD